MGPIASFHLTRYPRARAGAGLAAMAFDRAVLRAVPGLRFWRLLGTGLGQAMTPRPDLRRWAMFAVWDGDAALTRFLAEGAPPARWRAEGEESWTVRLAPAGWHGRWAGCDPLAGAVPAAMRPDEPVAVLTRAAIRPLRLAAFHRAVPGVERELRHRPGCLRAVGAGELPVVRQATFSLWRDAAAVRGFAYGTTAHRDVIGRVRRDGWYAEELFARFRPYGSDGSWDGTDPLGAG